MKNNTLSPLFLQSVIGPFPALNSVGSAIPLDIYNPNKTAMLVDQIRFSFQKDAYASIQTPYSFYTQIAVEVMLGSIPLTKKHVTLGALAPRYIGGQQQSDNYAGPAGDAGVVWHFPKPLYVPPLVQLSLHVQRQPGFVGDTGQFPATISALAVSVVGRSLPDDFVVPELIPIPWVTEAKCNAADTRYVSTDGDLVNSNNTELHVTQFVGINYNAARADPTPAELSVQMSLSNGTMLVRDQIPFFLAFPTDRGILAINARLQPGAFVRLELESVLPTTANALYGYCGFTAVAMHGYRFIQTPGTLG